MVYNYLLAVAVIDNVKSDLSSSYTALGSGDL